jgi:hypothetical protein
VELVESWGLFRILDAAGCMKKSEDQLRRTKCYLLTRVAKCTGVDGGDFGTFVVNCNRFVISA